MAHCKHCNRFMLINSQSGYCRECSKAVKKIAEAKRKAEEEEQHKKDMLYQMVDNTARRKKEEASHRAKNATDASGYVWSSVSYVGNIIPPKEKPQAPHKPAPPPKVEFRDGMCEFPYGDNRECFIDTVDIYLTKEQQERVYNTNSDFLEYIDPIKDVYEKVFNELAENLAGGYRQTGRMAIIRQKYAKNENESDESIAARILLNKNLIIGVPYKLRKSGHYIPMG